MKSSYRQGEESRHALVRKVYLLLLSLLGDLESWRYGGINLQNSQSPKLPEMRPSRDAPVAKRSGPPTSKARSFRVAKVARGCAIGSGERSELRSSRKAPRESNENRTKL